MTDVEKVIKGLEWCIRDDGDCSHPERCECPYLPGPHHRDCMEEMMLDALALLKEREPRVMTLEEVRDEAEYMFLEKHSETGSDLRGCAVRGDWDKFGINLVFDEDEWTKGRWRDYGHTWRCWTSRPTEEQRKRARWDDTLVL